MLHVLYTVHYRLYVAAYMLHAVSPGNMVEALVEFVILCIQKEHLIGSLQAPHHFNILSHCFHFMSEVDHKYFKGAITAKKMKGRENKR